MVKNQRQMWPFDFKLGEKCFGAALITFVVLHLYFVSALENFHHYWADDVVAREPPLWFRTRVEVEDAVLAFGALRHARPAKGLGTTGMQTGRTWRRIRHARKRRVVVAIGT